MIDKPTKELRIQLARKMGLQYKDDFNDWHWERDRDRSFDPENDANDADRVINWLRDFRSTSIPHGYCTLITAGRGVRVDLLEIGDGPGLTGKYYEGDNWKRGVCELALEVVGE